MKFIENSAMSGQNIEKTFHLICKQMLEMGRDKDKEQFIYDHPNIQRGRAKMICSTGEVVGPLINKDKTGVPAAKSNMDKAGNGNYKKKLT